MTRRSNLPSTRSLQFKKGDEVTLSGQRFLITKRASNGLLSLLPGSGSREMVYKTAEEVERLINAEMDATPPAVTQIKPGSGMGRFLPKKLHDEPGDES